MKKLIVFAIVIFGFTAVSFGQAPANATASTTATIITPIAIEKTTDMNFGNVIAGTAIGTVQLSVNNTRTPLGGVTLPTATPGTISAAVFSVSGLVGSTYSISLPSSLNITSSGNTMLVDGFVSTPTTTGLLGEGGTQVLTVGATLHVGVSQAAGTYTNASGLSVTVNYN